jgi:hypothetical protein
MRTKIEITAAAYWNINRAKNINVYPPVQMKEESRFEDWHSMSKNKKVYYLNLFREICNEKKIFKLNVTQIKDIIYNYLHFFFTLCIKVQK